jgi:hypothetical protein
MADPMYCEHQRTAATCEQCAHEAARKDPRRAAATRAELYPYPDGGAMSTGFLPDEEPEKAKPARKTRRA